jgi:hypothetical protein
MQASSMSTDRNPILVQLGAPMPLFSSTVNTAFVTPDHRRPCEESLHLPASQPLHAALQVDGRGRALGQTALQAGD